MLETKISPILSVECQEPKGPIERHVYPLVLTLESLEKLYELSSKHRVLFVDEIAGDFHKFCEVFMVQDASGELHSRGLYWIIDDFIGLFSLTNIERYDATAHFTFFDGRFRGRHGLVYEMLRMAFNTYKFSRITAEIGAYSGTKVFEFVERLGFKREGKKRRAVKYKDDMFDIYIYGILAEEIS